MSSKRWGAVAILALPLAACGTSGEAAPAAIPRERFVAANVALRAAADSSQPGRDAILRRQRVTATQLHAFVNAHAREPEYLAAVWMEVADSVERIDARTRRAQEARDQRAREVAAADSVEDAVPRPIGPGMGGLVVPPPQGRPPETGPPGARTKEPVRIPDTVRPVPQHRPPDGPPPDARRPWQPVDRPVLRPPPAPSPPER